MAGMASWGASGGALWLLGKLLGVGTAPALCFGAAEFLLDFFDFLVENQGSSVDITMVESRKWPIRNNFCGFNPDSDLGDEAFGSLGTWPKASGGLLLSLTFDLWRSRFENHALKSGNSIWPNQNAISCRGISGISGSPCHDALCHETQLRHLPFGLDTPQIRYLGSWNCQTLGLPHSHFQSMAERDLVWSLNTLMWWGMWWMCPCSRLAMWVCWNCKLSVGRVSTANGAIRGCFLKVFIKQT